MLPGFTQVANMRIPHISLAQEHLFIQTLMAAASTRHAAAAAHKDKNMTTITTLNGSRATINASLRMAMHWIFEHGIDLFEHDATVFCLTQTVQLDCEGFRKITQTGICSSVNY